MLSFVVARHAEAQPRDDRPAAGALCRLWSWSRCCSAAAVQQSYRRIRVAIAKINSYLQEHVNGIAVLQLFNREPSSRREFDRINRDHMEAYKDSITAYGWFYPVVEFLEHAGARAAAGVRRIPHPVRAR